jgi:hypothetical protein
MSESPGRSADRPLRSGTPSPLRETSAPRPLSPHRPQDVSRAGRGGIDCEACTTPDEKFLWTDANWRVRPTAEPSGLPLVLFLEPRLHVGEPGELPDDLAAELGVMISRIDRAVSSIDGIERVHICRWGEGSEHLHRGSSLARLGRSN